MTGHEQAQGRLAIGTQTPCPQPVSSFSNVLLFPGFHNFMFIETLKAQVTRPVGRILGILLGLDPEAKASRGLGGNGCLLQSKSPHLANGGSCQLGEDGRARQPKVGADRTKGCGGRVGVLPSSVQQGASQLQFHVLLGPSRSSAWSQQGVWCADVWGF